MPEKSFDYAKKSAELEQIVDRLQAGDEALDEAAKLYEQGMALVKELAAYLEQAENTVRKHAADE